MLTKHLPFAGTGLLSMRVRRGSLDPGPTPALKSIASGVAGRASLDSRGLALRSWQGLAEPQCPQVSVWPGIPPLGMQGVHVKLLGMPWA